MVIRIAIALTLLLTARIGQDSKVPVPSDEAQSQAEKTIRDVFKEEYAVKTSTAQLKLAKKLLQQGGETRDDATLRYILFREAADLASRSGDLETLQRSLDELCKGYLVDALALRESFLTKAEPAISKPEDLKSLAEAHFRLVREAVDLDQLDTAARSAQASLVAAKKSKDVTLSVRADALVKSVSEAKGAAEKAKKAEQALAAAPEDPNANQAWGEFLCLGKGQWEKGLLFLSKGADAALKALAAKELAVRSDLAPQMEVADGWWDLAGTEKSPLRKTQLLAHARTLYERALPNAAGLVRVKIEKRIAEAAVMNASAGASSRVSREGLVAWWKCDEGKGTATADSTGLGHEAALMNGVEWVAGRRGKALKFNGTNSYVSCKAANLPATNAVQTITWWHSQPNAATAGNMIMLSNDAQTAAVEIGLGKGRVAVMKLGGETLLSAPTPNVNVWYHCAYVFDGRNHFIHINGKLESSSSIPPQAGIPTKCEFGRWWGSVGSGYYNGILDDVRIYTRVLTDSEIQGLAAGND